MHIRLYEPIATKVAGLAKAQERTVSKMADILIKEALAAREPAKPERKAPAGKTRKAATSC